MSDHPFSVAFNEAAPAAERYDAQAELAKSHTDLSTLIPPENVRRVIDEIVRVQQDQDMLKASRVIPFPGRGRKPQYDTGMRSVRIDEFQVMAHGEFIDKQGTLGFDSLRQIVEQTPVLNSVIMTRIRQVSRFTRLSETRGSTGFEIRHIDPEHEITDAEKRSVDELKKFFLNCGWECSPRKRQAMHRKSFANFCSTFIRDSLSMDSAPIETEMKRDKRKGIDGFYNVDGATIRLCDEDGYQGDDQAFAVQVIQDRIRTVYTYDDLIYVPRNPRTDVALGGYGMSEVELMVRVVTGFLNAMTYNINGFSENSIPKGILHLSGDYDQRDLEAFKRYWNGMVKGVNNSWVLPVMVSKDQESKASFERFGVEFNEMFFSKWMTFLTSIICALYGMSPDEINFESFSAQRSSLSGNDTAEKLAESKDNGLRPLMAYMEDIFSCYIVQTMSEKYVFRWVGMDPVDQQREFEMRKLTLQVNEMRALNGDCSLEGGLGDAPVNPSLLGAWQQMQQQEDFGEEGGPEMPGGAGDRGREDAGAQTGEDAEDYGKREPAGDFGKSFPIIYSIES